MEWTNSINWLCVRVKTVSYTHLWGVYPDISKIANLTNLEYLHLGSGASVESIEPIAKLKNLVALSIENFQKINDYSPLTNLKNLESLSIEGDWDVYKRQMLWFVNFIVW